MYPDAHAFAPHVLTLGDLKLHILPYGLTLHRLLLQDRSGCTHDLLVGPEDPSDHREAGRDFFGPLVGRYANRLPAGRVEYKVGHGRREEMTLPEWGGDSICHHGGPSDESALVPGTSSGPFDRALWAPIPRSASSFFEREPVVSSAEALFYLESPHGSNGFPGSVRVEALVALLPPSTKARAVGAHKDKETLGHSAGRVLLQYRAGLIDDGDDGISVSATPLNLTQHWGFNLSASSALGKLEKGTIEGHTLRIYPNAPEADVRLLELDERDVPTGRLVAIPHEGAHDWTVPGSAGLGKRIAERMPNGGYDNYYIWGPHAQSNSPTSGENTQQAPQALLSAPSTGLALEFTTNQTGVQLYTTEHLPSAPSPVSPRGKGARKTLHCHGGPHDGAANRKRSAAALEFSHPHATFLHPELQRAAGSDALLRRKETYDNWVVAEVWEKNV